MTYFFALIYINVSSSHIDKKQKLFNLMLSEVCLVKKLVLEKKGNNLNFVNNNSFDRNIHETQNILLICSFYVFDVCIYLQCVVFIICFHNLHTDNVSVKFNDH